MYRVTFKGHKDGQMVLFDSVGADRSAALTQGQEFGAREFGHVEVVVGGEEPQGPRITNVEKYRWNEAERRYDLQWRDGYTLADGYKMTRWP